MIKQKNYPKVFRDVSGTFTDLSLKMLDYGRDSVVVNLATTDYLYFGRVKPFDCLYLEMKVANSVSTSMLLEYYDGSAWVDAENLFDDSHAFSRSGFIQFDKPSDWESTSVNATTMYFIRISVGSALSASTEIQGLNLVFSEDQDLVSVFPGVMQYLDPSENSFILRHQNSREKIVQDIRNRGFHKTPRSTNSYENYDEWDFLHVDEVRIWAIYLTMANIFSSLQSKDNDLYAAKVNEYLKEAELYKAAFYLSLDQDDDGISSSLEESGAISTRRLVRG